MLISLLIIISKIIRMIISIIRFGYKCKIGARIQTMQAPINIT